MMRWARTRYDMLRAVFEGQLVGVCAGVFLAALVGWSVQVSTDTHDNHTDIAVVMDRLEQIEGRVIATAKSQGAVEKHIEDLAFEARKQSETYNILRLELAGRIDRIQKQLGVVLSTRAAVDEMSEEIHSLRRDVEALGG